MSSRSPAHTETDAPARAEPLDFEKILADAIKRAEQDPAHLRALVYEYARFHIKREALFGAHPMSTPELTQQLNNLDHAIARVEENSQNAKRISVSGTQGGLDNSSFASVDPIVIEPIKDPIKPLALYGKPSPSEVIDDEAHRRPVEPIRPDLRAAYRIVGAVVGTALVGSAIIGAAIVIAVTGQFHIGNFSNLWTAAQIQNKQESTSAPEPQLRQAQANDIPTPPEKPAPPPYPLPTSYGVYVLNDDKLIELNALSMRVPDHRVFLSAEITKPSTITISSHKPAFIIFRRNLLTSAPDKLELRVIAQVVRQTKFVGGKPAVTKIEDSWRIRNKAYELKVSPVPTSNEMILAQGGDGFELTPGRYALVTKNVGYDFTVSGPISSPVQCLEKFETGNGEIFNECKSK